MDKAKILRLCNDIEDVACDIARITMNDVISSESRMIFDKAKEIAAEVSAKPKSNGDRIRQMTDEELAEMLDIYEVVEICQYCANVELTCIGGTCYRGILEWLKQEVKNDDER